MYNIHQFIEILAQTKEPKEIYQKLESLARTIGVDRFREKAAREIVSGTRPECAIPDTHESYRVLVCDGIAFFLSRQPLQRLLDVLVGQLLLDRDSSAQERLVELAKQFPTLHKLGQIIARHQDLDPEVKKWLVHLENGRYGTAPDEMLTHINGRLASEGRADDIKVDPFILSEASVGAVIPFNWRDDGDRKTVRGVFKILKPKIKEKLEQELVILRQTAHFFENHRHRYPFKDFRFLDIFEDVENILKKEIDLSAEQSHLTRASRFYENDEQIFVPDLLPFSDPTMTAMTHIPGPKVTDARLSATQRRQCAKLLMASLICRPLFADSEPSLFHGDPHAGNILAVESGASRNISIALLDWSLVGYLKQEVRAGIVGLIQSIFLNQPDHIIRSIENLAKPLDKASISRSGLHRTIYDLSKSDAHSDAPMKKAFRLLEQLSYEGVVFPPDLMLFRKSLFTLEGVLLDLHPRFDMDRFMLDYMFGLLADELPQRFGRFFFLQSDKAEDYRSLLSNADLQMLVLHQSMALFRHNTMAAASLFKKQTYFMNHLFMSKP